MSKLNWNQIKAWWFDPVTKRLGYAVLLSLVIHVLLIDQFQWIGFSKWSDGPRLLQAELIPAALPAKPATEAPPEPEITAPLPVPQAEPNLAQQTPSPSAPESSAAAVSAPMAQPEAVPQVESAVVAETPAVIAVPDTSVEEAPPPQPYSVVETEFDVKMNEDTERSGTAIIRYAKGENQTYELSWKVTASGLIGLVYPDLLQTSQGKITEAGLVPDYYVYQFGTREDKSYQSSFNWSDKQVALQSTKGTKHVPMEAGPGRIQDILSFMYQFMFVPPLNETQLYLTNGKKLALYDYAFVGEEWLALKFGNIQTYHIQHAKADSEDKTELWLATEYRYVPVKIRKTEKNGTVIEQIATHIKFETLENETPTP